MKEVLVFQMVYTGVSYSFDVLETLSMAHGTLTDALRTANKKYPYLRGHLAVQENVKWN